MTKGIDVSHYQGNVDWPTVKSSGVVDFSFIKATEGLSVQDSQFAANWQGARSAGLLRGAYHFFHSADDAIAQVKYFLNCVKSAGGFLPGDIPPVLDFENSSLDSGVSAAQAASGVAAWLKTI